MYKAYILIWYNKSHIFCNKICASGGIILGKIISIANNKGGVAKTTTTLNLAAALTRLGKKVLIIDLDPQSSLSINFGLEPLEVSNNIYNVLTEDIKAEDIICSTHIDNLYLLPANIELSKAELIIINKIGREFVLRDKLQPLKKFYDYILIDNSPSLGLLTINSLMASDYIISPTDPTYLAMRGLEILNETINEVKKFNKELKLLGVVVTMFDGRTSHHNEVLKELKKRYHVFDNVIKRSIKFSDSCLSMSSIFEFAGENFEGAIAYKKLAEEVVAHE